MFFKIYSRFCSMSLSSCLVNTLFIHKGDLLLHVNIPSFFLIKHVRLINERKTLKIKLGKQATKKLGPSDFLPKM